MRGKPFLERVHFDSAGCWIWNQSVTSSGYGMMPVGGGRFRAAHRYAYEAFVGPIPDGHHLHHVCEVRRCCNPSHLKPVTAAEHLYEHGRGYTEAEYESALALVRKFGVGEAARRSGISATCLLAHGARGQSPQKWTRDSVIEAIRTFHDRYGMTPGAMDWSPAMARSVGRVDLAERFYRDGCWPQVNTINQKFGSWNAAIAAAGFEPRRQGIKRQDVGRRRLADRTCRGCGENFQPKRGQQHYCTHICYRRTGLRLARRGGMSEAA